MNNENEERVTNNAVIRSAEVRLDREAFLSVWLQVDHEGGGSQGFGGYILGGVPDVAAGKHANQKNICADFIVGCLQAAEVDSVSKLQGKAVRVIRADKSWGAAIVGIGHIIKDDRWYNAKERMSALCGDDE